MSTSSLQEDIIAYAEEAEFDDVLELLDIDPTLARVEDGFGMLPLHWICAERHDVSLELIQRVVSLYPRALEHRTSSKLLPLHIALSSRWCALHLEVLLQHWPESVLALDGDGRSPVELAHALPTHTQSIIRRSAQRVLDGQAFERTSSKCRVQVEERDVVNERISEYQRPSVSIQLTGLVDELSKIGRELSKSNGWDAAANVHLWWHKPEALGLVFEPFAETGAKIKVNSNPTLVRVARGDVLVWINDLRVDSMPFGRIIEQLELADTPCRLEFVTDEVKEDLDGMMKRSTSSLSVASLASTNSSSMSYEQEQTILRVSNLLEETIQKVHEVETTFRMSMTMP